MTDPTRTLRMVLPDALCASAAAGTHNFFALVASVARDAGLSVEYLPREGFAKSGAQRHPGYSLFHMEDPFAERSVTVRRVYHYPFWGIERSAARWDWAVAKTRFDGNDDPDRARFYRFWQTRLFGDAPGRAERGGIVFVPLQGRIREKRSFQHCSPVQMIVETLAQEPTRQIVATLHPKESYTTADIGYLDKLAARYTRFSYRRGGSQELLRTCDYIVTQNSSLAFDGFFFGKPCVLFAGIDFHHIAANVGDLGAREAFVQVRRVRPDYAAYLHWFWQKMAINAGRPEARERIRDRLIRAGWPV